VVRQLATFFNVVDSQVNMSDERLIFEGNRMKSVVLLLGCALFLGVGIFFAQDGDRKQ